MKLRILFTTFLKAIDSVFISPPYFLSFYNPILTSSMIEEVDGRPVAQSLIDYEVTPILNLKREKDEEQINHAFVQLMEEFIAIA